MTQSFLTRNDDGFDSIAWCFETHVKHADVRAVQYAVLTGNEDSPERIDFYIRNNYKALYASWTPLDGLR